MIGCRLFMHFVSRRIHENTCKVYSTTFSPSSEYLTSFYDAMITKSRGVQQTLRVVMNTSRHL